MKSHKTKFLGEFSETTALGVILGGEFENDTRSSKLSFGLEIAFLFDEIAIFPSNTFEFYD